MKHRSFLFRALRLMSCAAPLASLLLSLPAFAASVALTTVPLSTATTTTVKPNMMFILDNSGSMNWDYLPDLVVDGNYCKGSSATGTSYRCCRNASGNALGSDNVSSTCLPSQDQTNLRGMPPFYSSDFNKNYYDPSITYSVPVNYDGTLKTSYTGASSVPLDGYGKQTTATLNLKTGYPDVEWCTTTGYTDCLRNDNYLLPGIVNSKSYTVMHETVSTGTPSFSTGTVAAPASTSSAAGPFYYVMVPGEYCTDDTLTDCAAATASSTVRPIAAKLRWCKNSNLTDCKATQNSSYNFPRYPTVIITAGTPAGVSTGQITVANMPQNTTSPFYTGTGSGCTSLGASLKVTVSSIKLNGVEILSSGFTYCDGTSGKNSQATRDSNLAREITARITANGFSGSQSGAVITVSAPDGTYNSGVLTSTISNATVTITSPFVHGVVAVAPVSVPGAFKRIDILSGQTYGNQVIGGQTVINRANRSDCAARPNCTYDEELANFANWFAWYRTRMQMMKTAVSLAYQGIDNRYRVGFFTINSQTSNYLKINTFEGGATGQKKLWYDKLQTAVPNGGTPLRSSLATVGRIFAGKNPLNVSGGDDPMQYSCQQNFAILTTDGYWNTDTSTDVKTITGGTLGNIDGGTTPRPMYEGPTASSGSLADVAKYYYDTDLRTGTLGNCTGILGVDVCENNVFASGTDNNIQQHMTTFTLGLGVGGTLQYTKDYKTSTSGDYYNIKTGSASLNWPVPAQDTATAVDDLWHAAVNGQGTYFSAKNPNELSQGINDALASIGMRRGAGAAAATSSLNPVAGNNSAYVASYTTLKWQGNLESRGINLTTGIVSEDATWCAEDVVAGACSSPSSIVQETSGSSTAYYCVTPGATASTCSSPSILDSGSCKTQMATSCTGTMAAKVAAATDTRTIKTTTKTTSGTSPLGYSFGLTNFTYDNLSSTQKSYFSSTSMSSLSQWSSLSTTQKDASVGNNVVNFLRGQTGYEDRSTNIEDNRLFRYREAVMGDAMESEPAFVGQPMFNYLDDGYAAFKADKINRAKTVYIGTNDGMLHAFNADDGTERWAFVPSMVIQNMWKLADKNYKTMHANYVNGSPTVADVYDTAAAAWKTILVSGLNGGGRGYFALDVTNPSSPVMLWEIDSSTDNDLGYSYGKPVVTKKTDGTWVVLLTSGYNNTSTGDGKGYLYVRNAMTGASISKIGTGAGSTVTPSGLGRISAWADDPMKSNKATYVYGGDLLGNVWRFDINAVSVLNFALLKDGSGNVQPITTAPELGLINYKRVVFVGTGKYLELGDLSDTQVQSLYAIKDDETGVSLVNPRTSLVSQTLTDSSTTGTRTGTNSAVDFGTGRGWYVDFPDSKERVHIDPKLDSGTLFVATTVPSSTTCSPGGIGWLNYFNYATGTTIDQSLVGQKFDGPIVGVNIFYTPDNKRHVTVVTSNNPTPRPPAQAIPSPSASGFLGRRAIWREITP